MSRSPDLGEFSVLRPRRRRIGIRQSLARGRRGRAPSRSLGSAELHSRNHWHARAKPDFLERGGSHSKPYFRGRARSLESYHRHLRPRLNHEWITTTACTLASTHPGLRENLSVPLGCGGKI